MGKGEKTLERCKGIGEKGKGNGSREIVEKRRRWRHYTKEETNNGVVQNKEDNWMHDKSKGKRNKNEMIRNKGTEDEAESRMEGKIEMR